MRTEAGKPVLIKRETPPSIEDEVAWAGVPGVLAMGGFEDERGRRRPSGPVAMLVREVLREMESTAVGFTVAEMEDMAGGALAE